jgi:hypothetical protein
MSCDRITIQLPWTISSKWHELTTATAPITPKKRVGAFHRDGKLTREGLLAKYQSYLVQELATVSWNLYGERDYAKHTIFFDRAVNSCAASR